MSLPELWRIRYFLKNRTVHSWLTFCSWFFNNKDPICGKDLVNNTPVFIFLCCSHSSNWISQIGNNSPNILMFSSWLCLSDEEWSGFQDFVFNILPVFKRTNKVRYCFLEDDLSVGKQMPQIYPLYHFVSNNYHIIKKLRRFKVMEIDDNVFMNEIDKNIVSKNTFQPIWW